MIPTSRVGQEGSMPSAAVGHEGSFAIRPKADASAAHAKPHHLSPPRLLIEP